MTMFYILLQQNVKHCYADFGLSASVFFN